MSSNMQTPPGPSALPYTLAPVPGLPADLDTSRGSFSFASSFSLAPNSLVKNLVSPGRRESEVGGGIDVGLELDPNASLLLASPVQSAAQRMVRRRELAKRAIVPGAASTSTPLRPGANAIRLSKDAKNEPSGLANEVHAESEASEVEEEWTAVDRMRLWRHDAMTQHLYESSIYWGDKVLSWTHDPNDAFWLAQAHFLAHQYSRAEALLLAPFPLPQEHAKSPKGKERAASPQHGVASNMNGFASRLDGTVAEGNKVGWAQRGQEGERLVDMSVGCRYLAAQCQVKLGKWAEALELLGETNPFTQTGRTGPLVPNLDGGYKVESSMCHLRGVLLLRLNRSDRAKQCFLEALALDVKCYDALEQLVAGEMMTVDEEWEFVQGLAYKEQTPEDAEFVRLMYMQRLKKYQHVDVMAEARKRLAETYDLSNNADVLFGHADTLYHQNRWADCFVITSQILNQTNIHAATLPLHLACMHHLPAMHSRLFLLAHELVEKEPESAVSWYAVGVWYLTQKKYAEGRKYFSKANLMEPRFGPAWIGFGHTFALEGEHDQAVTAYSTASRLFQGSHLPLLFIGMQHLQVFNLTLAGEHLAAAAQACDSDPLVFNEMGVLEYYKDRYDRAVMYLEKALQLAGTVQSSQLLWVKTRYNLAQAYRKLGRLNDAKSNFKHVLDLQPRNAAALTSLGMVHHLLGEVDDAIMCYHGALSIKAVDTDTITLLNLALEDGAESGSLSFMKGLAKSEEGWHAGLVKDHAQRDDVRKMAKLRGTGKGKPPEESVATSIVALGSGPSASVAEDVEM